MNLTYDEFERRALIVRSSIANVCKACGRDPSTVELLAVTKNHGPWAPDFARRFGLRAVGENRVQEGVDKRSHCSPGSPGAPALAWELIGHLQGNKTKLAVAHFDRIQSVDSTKLLDQLDKAAQARGGSLAILLQVNAGRDPAKFGVDLEQAPALLAHAQNCKALRVDGLMTIAPLSEDKDVARRCFATLRELRDTLSRDSGLPLPVLSMGMSGDLEQAIAEGSTQIRVGTALFGDRT